MQVTRPRTLGLGPDWRPYRDSTSLPEEGTVRTRMTTWDSQKPHPHISVVLFVLLNKFRIRTDSVHIVLRLT